MRSRSLRITLASLALSSCRVIRPTCSEDVAEIVKHIQKNQFKNKTRTTEPLRSYRSWIGHCELKKFASTEMSTFFPCSDTSYSPPVKNSQIVSTLVYLFYKASIH